MRCVAEVVADGRLQHLRDQVGHVAEPRDHFGGIVARNVDDLADVQIEGEAVGGAHGDRREVLVQIVRFGLPRRPVQNDIGRRHALHFVRVGVDGILARIEGLHPDSLLPFADEIAMLKRVAGGVDTGQAHVRNHDARTGDGDRRHLPGLHRRQPRIDEVTPGQNHLLLQALESAGVDEGLPVLEHVMPRNFLTGNVASRERTAFLGGDNAHHVVLDFRHRLQHHAEQGGVDAVGAGGNHFDLRAAFATLFQKRARILKGIALHLPGQHAAVAERIAVARLHNADVAFLDVGELLPEDVVLPGPIAEIEPGSEGIALKAGLAFEGDDFAVGQGLVRAPEDVLLVDDADGVLGDGCDAEEAEGPAVENQEGGDGD